MILNRRLHLPSRRHAGTCPFAIASTRQNAAARSISGFFFDALSGADGHWSATERADFLLARRHGHGFKSISPIAIPVAGDELGRPYRGRHGS